MHTVDLTGDDEDDSPAKRLKTSAEEKAPKEEQEPVSEEELAWREKQRLKREKDERAKKSRQASRQASLHSAFAAGAPKLHQGSADPIPKEVWQRILAHAPVSSLKDIRLVSKTLCDAVDDEGFLHYTKIAQQTRRMKTIDADRVIAEAAAGRRSARRVSGAAFGGGAVTAERAGDDDDAAGIIERIARTKPFPTPMSTSALTREVAIGVEWAQSGDERTPVVGHVPGAGLAAAVGELAGWRIVRGHGWALLAAAVIVAAEDYGTIALLLAAAVRACERTQCDAEAGCEGDGETRREEAGDYCAAEDLTEFVSLLTIALTVPSRWTRGAIDPGETHLSEPCATRMAHLDAAAGYLEVQRATTYLGSLGGFTSRLTHEQHSIVSADVKKDQVMLVRAFAGTGKTTTLLEYVKRRPGDKFAYITFNRSVMEEASTKFPKLNVKCLNFHKMAYAKFGFLYQGDKFLRGTLRQHHVAKAIKVNDKRALIAIRVLNEFLKSADLTVELKHAEAIRAEMSSEDWNKVYGGKSNVREKLGSQSPEENLVEMVSALWDIMYKPEDSRFPMTDAGYLKRYQLACRREFNPVRLDYQYDTLMLDEAQDAAPVMADIILSQKECGKILVGDPHQEIYSFMGAKNAMATVAATVDESKIVERRLSRSFRFGYEIADVANALLRLKGETACVLGARRELPEPVPGGAGAAAVHCISKGADVAGDPEDPDFFISEEMSVNAQTNLTLKSYAPGNQDPKAYFGEKGQQLAVLCRSNASLFDVASRVLNLRIKDIKLGFVGGLEGQRLGQLEDIWRLANCTDEMLDAITDKYIIRFRNRFLKDKDEGVNKPEPPFAELKSSAQLSNDMDMQTKISIVEKYKGNLPDLIARLKKVDVGTRPQDLKRANFILSTAHRAKGLEFDHVMLWKDFLEVNCCTPVQRDPATGYATLFRCGDEYSADIIGADELNIVYVAATRAMKRLIVNVSLEALLLNTSSQTWYLRAVPGEGPNRELLAKRRAGLPRFATLRCPTIGTGETNALPSSSADVVAPAQNLPSEVNGGGGGAGGDSCEHCSHGSLDTVGVRLLPGTNHEDRTPALGMEVRYGRTRSSDHVRDDPDKANPIGSNPLLPRDDGEWDGRLCGRCVRTYACSRRGAEKYLDDESAGVDAERTWLDPRDEEFFAQERAGGVDGGIGPIEGMSMMDIASVCAAERRARGEPWRGKDAAGLAVRIPE